jgi:hypothetical protein
MARELSPARLRQEVMIMPYHHTQRGTWMMAALLAAAFLDAVVPWTSGLVAFIVLIAAAVVFSSHR